MPKKVYGPGGMYFVDDDNKEKSYYDKILKAAAGEMNKKQVQANLEDFYSKKTNRGMFADGGKVDIEIKRTGVLHKEMGIPEGKKIPLTEIKSVKEEAKRDGDTRLVRQATFAENARGWK